MIRNSNIRFRDFSSKPSFIHSAVSFFASVRYSNPVSSSGMRRWGRGVQEFRTFTVWLFARVPLPPPFPLAPPGSRGACGCREQLVVEKHPRSALSHHPLSTLRRRHCRRRRRRARRHRVLFYPLSLFFSLILLFSLPRSHDTHLRADGAHGLPRLKAAASLRALWTRKCLRVRGRACRMERKRRRTEIHVGSSVCVACVCTHTRTHMSARNHRKNKGS